jgi:tetratricopeptide (TPR) repeat protein
MPATSGGSSRRAPTCAREGLAQALFALGERSEAIAHYQELLRLNPGDNQGVRYLLARSLLRQGEDQKLLDLLDQFEDDGMAEWLYTRALVLFRTQGAGDIADRALRAALKENPYVPFYLLGFEKLPARPPASYGFGDRNEAVLYVRSCPDAWTNTPGAVVWFMEHLAKEVPQTEDHAHGAGSRGPA